MDLMSDESNQQLSKIEQLPPPVEIKTKEYAVMTDEESKANLGRLGLTVIGDSKLRDFEQLGIHFKGVGVMKVQGGLAISAQLILHKAMTVLAEKLMAKKVSVKNAIALSKALGYSLSKLTESQKLTFETEGAGSGTRPSSDTPRVPSFPPGRTSKSTSAKGRRRKSSSKNLLQSKRPPRRVRA